MSKIQNDGMREEGQDLNIQKSFRSALAGFCADRRRKNGCIPHQITHPMLLLTVGSKVRDELTESVLPEFQRHWPESFTEHQSDGRIVVCSFDRAESGVSNKSNFFHHQLKCPLYSDSLIQNDADREECFRINLLIREAVQHFRVSGALVGKLRVVVLVRADDPDSILTGDLLSIARQHMRNLLGCTDSNNGIIGVFLSSDGFENKEHVQHTKAFFECLPVWHDRSRPIEELNPVYTPYTARSEAMESPSDVLPIVFRTYLLGDKDSNMVSTKNGPRSRIFADTLEEDTLFHGSSVQLLGIQPKKIDYEYVILSALDPKRWVAPQIIRENAVIEDIVDTIQKSVPNDLSSRIERRLSLVCIGRYVENAQYYGSLDEMEEEYFGRAFQYVFEDWMNQTLEKLSLPSTIENSLSLCRDVDQLEQYKQVLTEWIRNSKEPVPAKTEIYRREMIQDLWMLRDEISKKYTEFAAVCAYRIAKKWMQSALQLAEKVLDECVQKQRCYELFERVRGDMVQTMRHHWDKLLYTPYLGPQMRPAGREEVEKYESLIVQAIRNQDGKSFNTLLDMTRERIIHEASPDNIQGVLYCCTHVMDLVTSVEIQEGVSNGTVLTFMDVRDLGDVFIPDCPLSGIRP